MFPTFEIFGKTIGMYGVFAVLGIFASYFACYFAGKKRGIDSDDLILVVISAGIGVLIGGHLLYFFTYLTAFISEFDNFLSLELTGKWHIVKTLFSGSVFYGGFLGGILGVLVYAKFSHKNAKDIFDYYALATPLFHCFGRIGCFFAGCCYGCEANWGFTIYDNSMVPAVNNVQRIPIQLIEAFLNLIIFLIILRFFRKEKLKGELIYLYMLIYPVVRFVDEFFRGDRYRGIFFGLSTSQWISIILFVVAVIHFIQIKQKTKVQPT